MTWTLAPNLKIRSAEVKDVWPDMVIYSIGDQTHQAECSDHNPDSRGIVHAIDLMTQTDTSYDGAASILLGWLLADTTDLEYFIHNRMIYERSHGFVGINYTGTDPHTNHIHVSGRHGTTGKDAATCTGYSVTAENYTPKEITVPLTAADKTWIQAQIPTAADVAAAVLAYPLANGVVAGVNSKTGDFIRDMHWRLYSVWLAENQPAPTYPTPAKTVSS